MNCLEFHRFTLADPNSRDPGYLQHARQCAACRSYAERGSAFEDSLRDAMSVEVPADLLPDIMLQQAISAEQSPRRHCIETPAWWARPPLALAASLLVVALAGWLGLQWFGSTELSFPDEVIAHIEHEIEHLHEAGEVGDAKVAALIGSFGGHVEEGLGKVSYAGSCTIRNRKGLHMVLDGDRGPVTVFYIPGEQPGSETRFSRNGYQGELVPAGGGSLAIIGEQGEALAPIIARFDDAIAWGT